MINSIQKMSRDLSPSEHLILKCLCTGQSNLAITESTKFTVKSVENAISRSARVFGVNSTPSVNLRVSLALAYRTNFGEDDLGYRETVDLHLPTFVS